MISVDTVYRLKLDIEEIRRAQDRTGRKAERPLRWEGAVENPNGWRTMGDLANDLEEVVNALQSGSAHPSLGTGSSPADGSEPQAT